MNTTGKAAFDALKEAGAILQTEDYSVSVAPYAKGMLQVRAPSCDGYKTRAARLIGDGLNCRWTGRGRAYVASPSKVRKFLTLYAEGWDASSFSGELQAPRI